MSGFDAATIEALKEAGLVLVLIIFMTLNAYWSWDAKRKERELAALRERNEAKLQTANNAQTAQLVNGVVQMMRLQERNTAIVDQNSNTVSELLSGIDEFRQSTCDSLTLVDSHIVEHDARLDERVEAINNHTTGAAQIAQQAIVEELTNMEQRIVQLYQNKANQSGLDRVEQKLSELVKLVENHKASIPAISTDQPPTTLEA